MKKSIYIYNVANQISNTKAVKIIKTDDEYEVRFYKSSKEYDDSMTYYTDDREDALSTAQFEIDKIESANA